MCLEYDHEVKKCLLSVYEINRKKLYKANDSTSMNEWPIQVLRPKSNGKSQKNCLRAAHKSLCTFNLELKNMDSYSIWVWWLEGQKKEKIVFGDQKRKDK